MMANRNFKSLNVNRLFLDRVNVLTAAKISKRNLLKRFINYTEQRFFSNNFLGLSLNSIVITKKILKIRLQKKVLEVLHNIFYKDGYCVEEISK